MKSASLPIKYDKNIGLVFLSSSTISLTDLRIDRQLSNKSIIGNASSSYPSKKTSSFIVISLTDENSFRASEIV